MAYNALVETSWCVSLNHEKVKKYKKCAAKIQLFRLALSGVDCNSMYEYKNNATYLNKISNISKKAKYLTGENTVETNARVMKEIYHGTPTLLKQDTNKN